MAACGARYVSARETPAAALAAEAGGFDVVIVAAGDAQLSLDALGLLRRNGVAILLGIDGHDRDVTLPGPVIGVDAILGNRALLGSVNANLVDWHAAVEQLDGRAPPLARRARPLRRPAHGPRRLRRRVRVRRRQGDADAHQLTSDARRIAARSSGLRRRAARSPAAAAA